MHSQGFREMTQKERSLVARPLEVPFPGSEAIREQLRDALVRLIDD